MKKRILSVFMAICLMLTLLPTAALAVDDVGPATDYITVANGGISSNPGDVIITVVDSTTGQTLGRTTFQLDRLNNSFTITLTETAASEYEIESVSYEGLYTSSQTATQWQIDNWADTYGNEFTVTLCPEHEAPRLPEGEIGYGEQGDLTAVRFYRLYDEQILKMLRFKGVTVSPDTTIEGVTPTWVTSFGTPGTGSDKSFSTRNREHDYWELSVTTTIDNLSNVQPGNLRKLTITYDNGSGEQSVDIYSKDLRCVKGTEADYDHHYVIELDDDSFHIVYFYNAEDANTTNFTLYAVEFVDHGQTLGENMPDPPTYASGTDYQFVNWEQNSWNGTGLPLLSTTVINEDIVAFARKTSTSTSGTQIEVSNEDNQLFDRVAELYNATVSDGGTTITGDSINKESVYIIATDADGDRTENANEDGWKLLDEDWYRIFATIGTDNVDISTIQSITVYFQANGLTGEQSVTIPVGENAGDMTKLLDHTGGNVLQLKVIPKPTAPDDEELTGDPDDPTDTGLLSEGTVTVDCVGESDHAARTDGLLSETYSIGKVYWSGTSTEGAYYVDITIVDEDYDTYVEQYDVATIGDETHTVVSDEDESKTITLKYEGSGWTVPTGAIPVTIDVTCDTSSGGDLADNQIAIEVYLDGQQVEDGNTFSNYVSPASGKASDGTTGSGAWNADLDAYVYTYGVDTQNSAYVDLTVIRMGTNTIVQGIAADLVYGDGDLGITNQEDAFDLNNVTMRSTVKIYLNTVYTVAYSVPAGTTEPTDDGTYITIAALGSNGNDLPVEGGSSVEYRWINGAIGNDASDTYHTQITLAAVPTGLDGWYAEDNTTKYSGSATIDLTTASMDVLDADPDRTITFTAKETGSADITVTKDVTKVGDTAIPADAAQEDIPAALAGDEIVWTITVANEGGQMQTTDVTITENLTGAVIAQPAATGDYYTVSDDGKTITVFDLPAGTTETITVTYKVTADDVAKGTAIKNSVTVDDGDGDPTTEETEDEVPVVKADILDDPVIFHSVNGSTFETTDARQDTADYEHLVTTTNPAISYQAVLDLDEMVLQNTSNTNQSVLGQNIYETMKDNPWGLMKKNLFWGMLEHSDTIINLCVKFDSQLDVTETAMQNVTVTSPYFEWTGDPVAYNPTTGYWEIPCKAVDSPQTAGTDADDEVILSGITLNLTSAAQSVLNTSKVLTLTSGGYIDGTVTFGGALSDLNPLTVYGEATDDVVNLALDAWDEDNNTETGGDNIADKYQVLVKYTAGSGGRITGKTVEVLTIRDGSNQPTDSGSVTATGSTASASANYSFRNWTDGAGTVVGNSTSLGQQTIQNAQGGSTYTFTANFAYNGGGSDPGTGGSESDPYLRFDSNGGTKFDPIEADDSFHINVYDDDHYGSHIPTRPGYRFTGWYEDRNLTMRVDEDEELHVTGSKTVFAGWEETTVPSMLNGDDHYAYIQGYADGSVRPNANITRAQVATIFFRLLDEDVRDDYLTTYNTFPDVDQDYWANTAISTMASLGVINGRNSGLFDPDAYITRAEFAAICARFDDSGVDGITTFTDTVGHWAEDEISRAAALGWIQGYADGTFRPNQYITRAQAVTMINRVLCRLPETEDDLLTGMNTWTDCHVTDWFYLAIQEATNSHDFVAKDRVYESWTDLNRDPDWSRYE